MRRSHRSAALLGRGGIDTLLLLGCFCLAYLLRFEWLYAYSRPSSLMDHFVTNGWMLSLAIPGWMLTLYSQGGYDPLRSRSVASWMGPVVRASAFLIPILGSAVFLQQISHFSRGFFLLFLALSMLALALARMGSLMGARLLLGEGEQTLRQVLVVGTGGEALRVARALMRPEEGARVLGFLEFSNPQALSSPMPTEGEGRPSPSPSPSPSPLPGPILGTLTDLNALVDARGVDEVTFALPFSALADAATQDALWQCEQVGVEVRIVADFFGLSLSAVRMESAGGLPLLAFVPTPGYRLQFALKRWMDLSLASLLLLLLALPMGGIAVCVKLSSPGPILFRQTRSGLYGRPFSFLKFRSMYQDAEARRASLEGMNELSGPVFKIRDDPRVTPFGRFIRKYSLDELPQLFNVLRGEMSLVGPRPPLPKEVARYQRWQRRRLSMRPGLTCIWQVSGRNQVPFERWMEMDLHYIDQWSLWLDLRILLLTLPAVVSGRGAS